MKPSAFFRCALVAIVAVSCAIVSDAGAVSRSCGADAVANTTNVLCASGTCTAALVQVTTAIEVTSGGCDFDLGGRALSMERNFQMTGTGFIRVFNAGNITVTSTGRFQARGDFVLQNGSIVTGGLISLTSTGVINIAGKLDVTGDSAGTIRLVAAGNVTLQSGSEVKGSGISSFPDLGMLFTDGGELEATGHEQAVQRGVEAQGLLPLPLDPRRSHCLKYSRKRKYEHKSNAHELRPSNQCTPLFE